MAKFPRAVLKGLLLLLKPLLTWLFLRNPATIAARREQNREVSWSGMVSEFNLGHRLLFVPFFRRVQTVAADIPLLKDLTAKGPVVYVMKNRGRLEYRYFNHLFLREKIPLVRFANNCLTVMWWPLRRCLRILLDRLDRFYSFAAPRDTEQVTPGLVNSIAAGRHALINLSISRDYLFGLIQTNPLDALLPLIEIQKNTETPVHVVPLQFLYDKKPESARKSYFDLMFGEKSQPGALRKSLLFLNFRKKPLAKFGTPLNLKEFLATLADNPNADPARELLGRIKESLRIEQARLTGPVLIHKSEIIRKILVDPAFSARIDRLAAQTGKTPAGLKREAEGYLREIGADVNYSYVEFLHVTLTWVWEHVFDGWVVNEEGLNRVREVAGKNPIVLVPMHRSHIDYLLISYIFYDKNITFPHVCAGINLNFWPAGRIIRKGGGFFIRRSFGGNRVYKESLYAYLKSLMATGHCIEFFIEGTRSRTGKLLSPKMGVLNLLLRAFTEGAAPDIIFVPVAINYDHIPEQKAYQSESAGVAKSKENAGELLKARKVLGKKYGKIYLQFGDPISLRDYFEAQQIAPDTASSLRKETGDFAYHLTYNINRLAIVTPIALVSLALLAGGLKSVTMPMLLRRIALFKGYLDHKGAVYTDVIHFNAHWAVVEALKSLKSRNLIKEVQTFEESFYTMEDARRADLNYYKNNIVHFFVSLVCFLKILKGTGTATITLDQAVKQYDMLKTLFRHDFIFSARASLKEHLTRVIEYCHDKSFCLFDRSAQTFTTTPTAANSQDTADLSELLDNFLESHLIMLRYLRHNAFEGLDRKSVIRDVFQKAQNIYLKGDLKHPEALSHFNLQNSLKVFTDIGVLKAETKDKDRIVYTNRNEVELIETWIASLRGFLRAPGVAALPAPAAGAAVKENEPAPELH